MDDCGIPRQLLYGEFFQDRRKQGKTLQTIQRLPSPSWDPSIPPQKKEAAAVVCHGQVKLENCHKTGNTYQEQDRTAHLLEARERWKAAAASESSAEYDCSRCQRTYKFKTGIVNHTRAHNRQDVVLSFWSETRGCQEYCMHMSKYAVITPLFCSLQSCHVSRQISFHRTIKCFIISS